MLWRTRAPGVFVARCRGGTTLGRHNITTDRTSRLSSPPNPHFPGGERRCFSVSSRCAMKCFPGIRTSLAMLIEARIILNFADSAENTGPWRRAKQDQQLGDRKVSNARFCFIEKASRIRFHILNLISVSNFPALAPGLHFQSRPPCM